MKTAMQELRDDIAKIFHDNKIPLYLDIAKYLEKEKEQICNAYTDGLEGPYVGAEEYYNETYKNEG